MAESDSEFLDGLIGRPITVADRVRLFALARKGAEADAGWKWMQEQAEKTAEANAVAFSKAGNYGEAIGANAVRYAIRALPPPPKQENEQ